MTNKTEGRSGISIEADEAIRAGDQIAHDSQTRKGRRIVERNPASLRAKCANMQFQSALAKALDTRIADRLDSVVDAVEIDIYVFIQSRLGETKAMIEIGFTRGDRHHQPKFFSAQFHGGKDYGRG